MPVVNKRYDLPGMSYPNHIFKNYGVATGCMLIKREVFEKISRPWFALGMPEAWLGEDIFFCRKCKENGIEIWMDASLSIKHIGEHLY